MERFFYSICAKIVLVLLVMHRITAMHMCPRVQQSLQKGINEMIQSGHAVNVQSGAIMIFKALEAKSYDFIRADKRALELSAAFIEQVKINPTLALLFEKARSSHQNEDWFAWHLQAANSIKEQMKPYIIFPDEGKGRFYNRVFLQANTDFNAYMHASILRAGIYCL